MQTTIVLEFAMEREDSFVTSDQVIALDQRLVASATSPCDVNEKYDVKSGNKHIEDSNIDLVIFVSCKQIISAFKSKRNWFSSFPSPLQAGSDLKPLILKVKIVGKLLFKLFSSIFVIISHLCKS